MNYYKNIVSQILKMTSDGFIITDTEGNVREINKQYADFFGKSRSEIIGKSILNIIPNSKMIDIVKHKFSEEDAVHKYIDGEAKGNSVIVSRSYVEDEDGNVVAGVAQVKFKVQTLAGAKKLMNEYEELEYYREEFQNQNRVDNIIGSDTKFREIVKECLKVAKTDIPVLLTGETGTGKEVMAKALHTNSLRYDKPFVNCAAIPFELLESELFGYMDGAFTGAKRGGKKGKFQLANGGTIFLDEIGDLDPSCQVKLLRVLQDQTFEVLGDSRPRKTDIRVVSATNADLRKMVGERTFREDLFYRINLITVKLPALRERREDIPLLARHFADRQAEVNGLPRTDFSADALNFLSRLPYPGNIRELKNLVERTILVSGKPVLDATDFDAQYLRHDEPAKAAEGTSFAGMTLDEIERQTILQALEQHKGNLSQVAVSLGISRAALYRRLEKYNIQVPCA